MLSTVAAAFRRFKTVDWAIFLASVGMAAGFYLLRSQHREAYYPFVKEDGPAETFQALSMLLASGTAAATALRLLGYKQRLLATLFAGFAVLAFAIFGEEISWGQRIFGWSSNEYFQSVNMQKETNLHNDVRLKYLVHPTIILVGLFATVSPFLYERLRRLQRNFLTFFATEFPTVVYFAVLTGVYVVYEYLNPAIAPLNQGFELILWQDLEMAETFFYAGVLGWTILKLRGAKALLDRHDVPVAGASRVTSSSAREPVRAAAHH